MLTSIFFVIVNSRLKPSHDRFYPYISFGYNSDTTDTFLVGMVGIDTYDLQLERYLSVKRNNYAKMYIK